MRFTIIRFWLVLLAGSVFGQGDRGTITGTVSDPAGAVVAGAAIEAKHVETGAEHSGRIANDLPVPHREEEMPAASPRAGFERWGERSVIPLENGKGFITAMTAINI